MADFYYYLRGIILCKQKCVNMVSDVRFYKDMNIALIFRHPVKISYGQHMIVTKLKGEDK